MSVLSSPKTSKSACKRPVAPGPDGVHRSAKRASRIGRFLDDRLRSTVFKRLARLEKGRLTVIDGERQQEFGTLGAGEPTAELHIRDPRFYRRLVLGGSLGAADSFIRGEWDCDNLVDLLRLICRNPAISGGFDGGLTRLIEPFRSISHRLCRNTPGGSRRNIAAHYDLGEDFFSLFLDDTMAYSCGIFPDSKSTLREASVTKFERVCLKLQLSKQDNLIEIGSGWGGFAVYAARHYGCRVTTTTISNKQYEFTIRRVKEEGLADRVTVLCEDYRNLSGQYDKLVSIEMIEAVGCEYFDTYFKTCSDLLKPDGMMLLQAITIPDQRFDQYRRSVDFIQRYVFPGGCLPSLGAIFRSLGRVTDMLAVHLEDFTSHYARTLAHWRHRFHTNLDKIRELALPEEFLRLWEFYFCYCEAGFLERMIGEVHLVLCKPQCPPSAIFPARTSVSRNDSARRTTPGHVGS